MHNLTKILFATSLFCSTTLLAQADFRKSSFATPKHQIVPFEGVFFLPEKLSFNTIQSSATNDPMFKEFRSLFSIKSSDDLRGLIASEHGLKQQYLDQSFAEIKKIKATNTILNIRAVISLQWQGKKYKFIKFDVSPNDPNAKPIYAAYPFIETNNGWKYMLNNKMIPQTVAILAIKSHHLKNLLSSPKNDNDMGRALPRYCYDHSQVYPDLFQIGREILSYNSKKNANQSFLSQFCNSLD